MSPNPLLIQDYSTFGDLTQRDIYLRNKHQVVKDGVLNNSFYHVDASGNVKTNIAVEKVSMEGDQGRFHIFTKASDGAIDVATDSPTLQMDPADTYLRSTTTHLNILSTGTITSSGALIMVAKTMNVYQLQARTGGILSHGPLNVDGQTTMSNVFASGSANVDTLRVRTTANIEALVVPTTATIQTADIASLAVDTANLTTLNVSGTSSLNVVSATGNVALSGSAVSITSANLSTSAATHTAFGGNVVLNGARNEIRNGVLTSLLNANNNGIFNVSSLSSPSAGTMMLFDQNTRGINLLTSPDGSTWTTQMRVRPSLVEVTANLTAGRIWATNDANVDTLRVRTTANIEALVVPTTATIQTADIASLAVDTANLTTLNVSGTSSLNVVSATGNVALSGSAVSITSANLSAGAATHTHFGGNVVLDGARNEIRNGFVTSAFNFQNNKIVNAQHLTHFTTTGGSYALLDRVGQKIELRVGPDGSNNGDNLVPELVVGVGNVQVANALGVAGSLTVQGLATVNNDLVVNGNLQIMGTATKTEIQSTTVQVGDTNIELGYLETGSLANLTGAGITIGGAGASFTRPEIVYDNALEAWTPNYDLVLRKATGAIDVATIDTDGYFRSANAASATTFTKMDSTSFNFSDKWRMTHVMPADEIELQHYDSNTATWVTKFTFTT